MTVQVSNTELNHSFDTWRRNTNFIATVVSNNAVTVWRDGSANRGGSAVGNAHITGTFTANQLRASSIVGGNTINQRDLYINSNVHFTAANLEIVTTARTRMSGNVIIDTSGSDVFDMGDVSRLRLSGGSTGQFFRKVGTSGVEYQNITLRQISDLESNSSHITLSSANSSFITGATPHLIFTNGVDSASMYMAIDATAGDSDVYLKLADSQGDSSLVVADSANNRVFLVTSDGIIKSVSNAQFASVTANGHVLPGTDDLYDLGASGQEWRNLYVDGTAEIDVLSIATGSSQGVSTSLIPTTDAVGNLGSTSRKWGTIWGDNTNGGAGVFNTLGVSSTLNVNGAVTFNNSATLNGDVTLGDADTDTITVKGKFANIAVTGVSSFNGTTNFNGTMNINGAVNLGDAASDTLTVTSTATLDNDVNIGSSSADTVTILSVVDSNIIPDVDNATGHYTLGTSGERWNATYANTAYANTLYVDNNATIYGDMSISGNVSISSGATVLAPAGEFDTVSATNSATFNGTVTLGNETGDNININGSINTDVIPVTGERHNLGTSASKWHNVYANNVIVGDEMTVTNKVTVTKNLTVSGNTQVTNNLNVDGNITADGTWKNDSTVIVGKNGRLHANNAITADTIRNSMILNDHIRVTAESGSAFDVALGETFNISAGEGINTTLTANTVTIAGELATSSNKGVASFDSGDFDVSSGAVSLKDATTGAVLAVSGTTSEVEVSRSNGTVTVGLPNNVTIGNNLAVTNDVTISGDLTVTGETNTATTTNLEVSDALIGLQVGITGANINDVGLVFNRGSSGANGIFIFDESADTFVLGTGSHGAGASGYLTVTDGALKLGSLDVSGNVDVDGTLETDALSLNGTTVTATGTELSRVSGVTSAIQTQLNNKMSVANTQALAASRLGDSASITLSGDVSGSGSFSSNAVNISVTVADDSHNHVISNVDGLQSSLNNKMSVANTQALANARLGDSASITLTGAVTGSGSFSSNSVSITTTATADPVLTLSGDASGSCTFTNLGNATLSVTIADDSHTHDGRYYTETEADTRFVNASGDTMSGNLAMGGNDITGVDDIALTVGSKIYWPDNSYGGTGDTCYIDQYAATGEEQRLRLKMDNDSTDKIELDAAGGVLVTRGTLQGTATSAQYADLAEKYLPDAEYRVGTVMKVGGENEVTASTGGSRAIGVISENPAYMMNSELEGGVYVALKGRVPVRCMGPISKGDELVPANDGLAFPGEGKVFAVALEDKPGAEEGMVECVIL